MADAPPLAEPPSAVRISNALSAAAQVAVDLAAGQQFGMRCHVERTEMILAMVSGNQQCITKSRHLPISLSQFKAKFGVRNALAPTQGRMSLTLGEQSQAKA